MTRDDIQAWTAQARSLTPKHRLRYLLINLGLMAQEGGVVHVDEASFVLWEREIGIDADEAQTRLSEAREAGWLRVRHSRGLELELQLIA